MEASQQITETVQVRNNEEQNQGTYGDGNKRMDSVSVQEIVYLVTDQVWPEEGTGRRHKDLKILGLGDWVDCGEEGQSWEKGWEAEMRIQLGTCYVSGVCESTSEGASQAVIT